MEDRSRVGIRVLDRGSSCMVQTIIWARVCHQFGEHRCHFRFRNCGRFPTRELEPKVTIPYGFLMVVCDVQGRSWTEHNHFCGSENDPVFETEHGANHEELLTREAPELRMYTSQRGIHQLTNCMTTVCALTLSQFPAFITHNDSRIHTDDETPRSACKLDWTVHDASTNISSLVAGLSCGATFSSTECAKCPTT